MPASCIAARTASLSSTTRPKCRAPSCGLWTGTKRDELIADVDKAHPPAGTTTQLEFEEAPVPAQGLVEVADLERYVVDPTSRGIVFSSLRLAHALSIGNWSYAVAHILAWSAGSRSAGGPAGGFSSRQLFRVEPPVS